MPDERSMEPMRPQPVLDVQTPPINTDKPARLRRFVAAARAGRESGLRAVSKVGRRAWTTIRAAYVGRQPMTLNSGIGAPHTPLALFDVKLRGDSPPRRAPVHPHAGQRRGLVPFVGSPVPKTSTVLVRSVRYGGPTATQRQAPQDLRQPCEGQDTATRDG